MKNRTEREGRNRLFTITGYLAVCAVCGWAPVFSHWLLPSAKTLNAWLFTGAFLVPGLYMLVGLAELLAAEIARAVTAISDGARATKQSPSAQ